jgi:hypothetical protein
MQPYLHEPYLNNYIQFPLVDWITAAMNIVGIFMSAYLLMFSTHATPFKKRLRPIIVAIFISCVLAVLLQISREMDGQSYFGMIRRQIAQTHGFCDAFVMLVLTGVWIKGMVPSRSTQRHS